VDTGYWPLFRYDPRLAEAGQTPLKLDSPAPKVELAKFMANETRFGILKNINPDRAESLAAQAQAEVHRHYAHYQHLAEPAKPAAPTVAATPAKPDPVAN